MKNKILTALLVGLLLFSSLNFALAKEVRCPTCHGAGTVDCPECSGTGEIIQSTSTLCENCSGTGALTPRVSPRGGRTVEVHDGSTFVTVTFYNKEIVPVDGRINATISSYSYISDVITFPPNEDLLQELESPM